MGFQVRPRLLEDGDSLRVERDGTRVVLSTNCAADDMDGLSLNMHVSEAAVVVDASIAEQTLHPALFRLGRGKSVATVPFKVRASDERLHLNRESPLPGHRQAPEIVLWSTATPTLDALPVLLDEPTENALRALGYLR
jgi:hypothetical protein